MFPFLNFTALSMLIVPIIFALLNKWKNSNTTNWFPPGPKTLPVIGHLHLISSIPFRSFKNLSEKYGPIMHLKLGETSAIIVSSPEIAREVLKEHDPIFTDRPDAIAMEIMFYGSTNIAFCPYGEYWRQMRKISILELLSAKMVKSFGSIRNDESSRMIEWIRETSIDGKPWNFTERIIAMSSSTTSRAAFGNLFKERGELVALLKEASRLSGGFEPADLFPSSKIVKVLSWFSKRRMMVMRREIDRILDDIIYEHRKNRAKRINGGDESVEGTRNGEFGDEDLVDVLLRVKENGELQFPVDDDNIKAVIANMFLAGTDTSATAIDWTMAELLRNPHVMAKAQAEIRAAFENGSKITDEKVHKLHYLKLVIKESLRIHPPAPVLPRVSRAERKIHGYTLPAKTKVMVNCWAMQRDPKYWTDPESFVPERFEKNPSLADFTSEFHYLPFGAGRRMCPGVTFGLTNLEVTLAQLLYSFDWKLPQGVQHETLDMMEIAGVISARKEQLFVVATPYEPSTLY